MSDVPEVNRIFEAIEHLVENHEATYEVGLWIMRQNWKEPQPTYDDMARVALEKLYALEDVRG